MPKGVRKEDEGRRIVSTARQGGTTHHFFEIDDERLQDAEELLSWSRSLDDHGLHFAGWQELQTTKREKHLTLTVPQVLAMYSILTYTGFKPVQKFSLLSQDDYGNVIVTVDTAIATGRYKLLTKGGYETLEPIPVLKTVDGEDEVLDDPA